MPQPCSGLLLYEYYGYALHSYLMFLDYPIKAILLEICQCFSKITVWDWWIEVPNYPLFMINFQQIIINSLQEQSFACFYFQLHFRQKAVGNILVNRIPSWSGKLIHNVKNINAFSCTMIKDRCKAFQLRQNISVRWLTIINV